MGRQRIRPGEWSNPRVKSEGRGRWIAKTTYGAWDGTTRRVQASGSTKQDAVSALQRRLSDVEADGPTEGLTRESRIAQAVDVWWTDVFEAGLAPATLATYERLARQMRNSIGNRRLDDITVSFCERYLRQIASEHPTKAKHHKTVLFQVLGVAVRHGAIRENPAASVGRIRRAKAARRTALTGPEVAEVRRAIRLWHQSRVERHTSGPRPDPYLVDLIDVALGTGARIGEILALRWEDIDFNRSTVLISGTVDKSGNRQRHTKTRLDRELIVPRFTVDSLMARKVNQSKQSFTDAVFPSRTGRFRSTSSVHRAYANARAEQQGLPEHGAFHLYRHALATLIAETHGDLGGAARQLGHSSEHVTDSTYVHRLLRAPDNSARIQQFVVGEFEHAAATDLGG